MSAASVRADAERFAVDLFQEASDELLRGVAAGDLPLADIAEQLTFFHTRARRLTLQSVLVAERAGADMAKAWLAIAKEKYRSQAADLLTGVLEGWQTMAPRECRSRFRKSIRDQVPVATALFVLRDDFPAADDTRRTLKGLFDCLAEMAGLKKHSYVQELREAAFDPIPLMLPGLGG